MIYINHSCEPNVGMKGEDKFIAMRDIEREEELTIDYSMIDDNDMKMECTCRSFNCRKVITGKDWMLKELQEKYKEYFSSFIKKKIMRNQLNKF